MRLIINRSTAPPFNLALEEYVLTKMDIDIIMLWRNEPSVIVGRNQNTMEEIDIDFVRKNDIHVIRRLSGGGAVFHDLGNINFTVIHKADDDDFSNYSKFTEPVCSFLQRLGVSASLDGRNDLVIDGAKFSGNAQAVSGGRFMHHGTILFSTDVSLLSKALKPNAAKIESKGVKSVRRRVTNVNEHLSFPLTVDEFFDKLTNFFFEHTDGAYLLTDEDIASVHQLVKDKYGTWEWNIGHSPLYGYNKLARLPCGIVDIHLSVTDGVICEAQIFGDFFGMLEIGGLAALLIGVRHEKESVCDKLAGIDLNDYISGITMDQFLSLF